MRENDFSKIYKLIVNAAANIINGLNQIVWIKQHKTIQDKMCDVFGDETKGLLLDSTVFINKNGQVLNDQQPESREPSEQETGHIDDQGEGSTTSEKWSEKDWFEVKKAYECYGGSSILDVLPLIGHQKQVLAKFVDLKGENLKITLKNNVLEDIKTQWRQPGAFLVKENARLWGVVINEQNEALPLGVVTKVMPNEDEGNTLMIGNNFVQTAHTNQDINLDWLVMETQARIGIVSIDGFLLVQSTVPKQLATPIARNINKNRTTLSSNNQLILMLQNGYVSIHEKIDWIRKNIDSARMLNPLDDNNVMENATAVDSRIKMTDIEQQEVFICCQAAIIAPQCLSDKEYNQEDGQTQRMKLIGSQNAIVNYTTFKHCIQSLNSIDYSSCTTTNKGRKYS